MQWEYVGNILYALFIRKFSKLALGISVAACIFVLAILVAYASYRLYDLPVREWLKKKLFKPTAQKQ